MNGHIGPVDLVHEVLHRKFLEIEEIADCLAIEVIFRLFLDVFSPIAVS